MRDIDLSGIIPVSSIQARQPGEKLTPEELRIIAKLREIDRRVRAHEMAHLMAAGRYVISGPHYKYETGPDGKRYAVAGEVEIDTSEEKDPEETIKKMEVVKRAALAPADPSPQDYRVAQEAAMKEMKARQELARKRGKQTKTHSIDLQV